MVVLQSLLSICIGFQAFHSVVSKSVEDELGTIIFANVMYRHGDRTPIDPYPTDPYGNMSYWPVGFGQLTNTGKQQHYELGQWLRNRYDTLLTEKYSRDIIYVHSTDVDRTLMSAECNLAGMYPPISSQIWNKEIHWQPIPIHTTPEKLDNMLAAKRPCPAYDKEFDNLLQTKEMQTLNDSFLEVYKTLNEYSGEIVTTLQKIDWVYNTLWVENLYNFTLPEWTKPIFPHPMSEASRYSFALPTWTKKLARLKSGVLVNEMIHSMRHKLEKNPKPIRNVNIYSAHDTSLANIMNTLGVYNMVNPPYRACFMMELRVNSTGDHQVTLFYRNSTTEDPYLLTLPGCTPICPLDQFISLLKPVTLTTYEWEYECQSSVFSSYSTFTVVGSSLLTGGKHLIGFAQHLDRSRILGVEGVLFALAVLAILLLVLLGSGVIYWQRRKRATYCRLG